MTSARAVHALLDRAVERAQIESATLLVARDGEPLLHAAYGGGAKDPRAARLDRVFDLASLTKALATTTTVMQLVDAGKLALSTRVADVLPSLAGAPCGPLTVARLLEHSSGLPAWRPYFEQVHPAAARAAARRDGQRVGRGDPERHDETGAQRKAIVRRLVAAEPLDAPPGARTIYSDLGFILLDWIIERVASQRLDVLFARRVAAPLGLSHAYFIDLDARSERERERRRAEHAFAPTERCPWRRRRLVAEVHDDNCHAMGGVSGHAGLFGTAHSVHVIARELVAAYRGERSLFGRDVVRRFFDHRSRVGEGDARALGFDRVSPEASSAGTRFSARSVGHLGFTGTSLWIDLDAYLWVVLLSNRVYYGREPNPMKRLRPALHDRVRRAFD